MAPAPVPVKPSETDDFTPEEMALLTRIREFMDSRKNQRTPKATTVERARIMTAGAGQ